MKEEEIINNNALIAEFMGGEYTTTPSKHSVYVFPTNPDPESSRSNVKAIDELKYHQSYSWLMSVVENIESLRFTSGTCTNQQVIITINRNTCYISIFNDTNLKTLLPIGGKYYYWHLEQPTCGKSKLEAVYNAVVQFIKWYNNDTTRI
jgi:hypothetical protein